ncbi:MAG: endo-1,4-beta-xylanase Z [Bacteroidales bacterium]|nr:endo-1,4-beta-xylanase Z [Bacteroidales bacterium]
MIMKKLLLLAALCCTLPLSAQWMRQITPADTLHSTVVLPDGKVIFQIYAPKARTVAVTGDLPWDKPVIFREMPNGVWKGVCDGLGNGVFRYRFIVDGITVQDPKSPQAEDSSALVTVGESYVKDVPHGALAQRWYYSKTLGGMRRMHVWTPAGYENSKAKLPVLYLIHGGGDNDASWPTVGAAGWILDNLLAEGKIVPMIVVMPNGTINNVPNEVPPFADDMFTDIIPLIEANYRVIAKPEARAVAGLSMGGMETMEVIFRNPDMFRYAWVLSSSLMPGSDLKEEAQRLNIAASVAKINKLYKAFVFTQGGPTDIAYQNCINTRKFLQDLGLKFDYMENAQAGHSWTTWRADLATLAPTLFR